MMTEKSGVCVIMADVSGKGVWVLVKEVGLFGVDAGEKYWPALKLSELIIAPFSSD